MDATQTTVETGMGISDLIDTIDFQQLSVKVFGKQIPQPRLVSWYGPCAYAYSGLTLPADAMPDALDRLCKMVSDLAGEEFNSVMCNLYRDGGDSVGWHSDDEPEFGDDPVIASLSFGASRRFILRNKATKQKQVFELGNESVLVMGRGLQSTHDHSVPKTKKIVEQRINLTFRRCVK